MKKYEYKVGDKFKRTGFEHSEAILEAIQTHRKDSGGKNTKLPDPILHFGYSDKENKFSMYSVDADRLIHFERWEP
jgi:hypothetical protein